MTNVSFAMALHFHQPVGNFESIIARAYKNCYLPFLKILYQYPDIKMTFHISGCLLDYLEAKHPEFLDKLNEMVIRGQIEFLGGAYYEPVLISIPHRDLSGQIKMMSNYIRQRFHRDPNGIWIPERVWKPMLSDLITACGIKYCILDDTHILRAGVLKEKMYGYFLTGGGARKLAVFPSDKRLRYNIPFGKPYEIIAYFKEVASMHEYPLFVYGDDAEKFGEWPGTYGLLFEQGWLKIFFDELRRNKEWLELIHFSNYINSHPSLGEIEIPEAAYDEMLEWTGGSWLNFFKKYPESNHMHKKMCYVSHKLEETIQLEGENITLEEATRNLYKGQCNCAYWHGVFGGLYLYHLRNAVYNNLISSEKKIDELLHKKDMKWLEIKRIDFDSEGIEDIIMGDSYFALYIDPSDGGTLKELDYKPLSINLVNTLSRRKESYHQKILETIGKNNDSKVHTIHEALKSMDFSIDKNFIYDKYTRYCLRDYFFKALKLDSFMNNSFEELGNFSEGIYEAGIKENKVVLERTEHFGQSKLKVSKEIEITSNNELGITYYIERENSKKSLNALLGTEFNLTMPFLNSERYRYVADRKKLTGLNEYGEIDNIASFGIIDSERNLNIKFGFSDNVEVFYFPVRTVSQSERAYELNFQCSCLLFIWKLNFGKNNIFKFKINISLDSKQKVV